MLTRRYRVLFHVRFDHDIEAPNIEEARLIANTMATKGWPPLFEALLTGHPELHVAWNTITPFGELLPEEAPTSPRTLSSTSPEVTNVSDDLVATVRLDDV